MPDASGRMGWPFDDDELAAIRQFVVPRATIVPAKLFIRGDSRSQSGRTHAPQDRYFQYPPWRDLNRFDVSGLCR